MDNAYTYIIRIIIIIIKACETLITNKEINNAG